MFSKTLQISLIIFISFLIMGISSPAQAKRIQDITYKGGGKIVQYRDANGVAQGATRICLINRTNQPKMIKWIRVSPKGKVNNMSVPRKGGKSCVSIPNKQRIQFNFMDSGRTIRKDAMTLNNWSGDLVTFDWVKDNNHTAKANRLSCGANNQRPCKIWERIPSCNKGLYEDFKSNRCRSHKKLKCGAINQRPCNVWERIPSCNRGLVENFLAHRCVKGTGSVGGDLKANAEAVLRDSGQILSTLGGYLSCFDKRLLEQAISKKDAAYAKKLQNSSCVKRMGGIAYSQGYNTLTVGISGGGSFIIGGFLDTGFAFDTKGRREPTLYQTKAINVGIQAGGGAGVNLGLYKGSNKVDARGSDTQGFSFEAGAGAGGGTGIWYDYNGKLDGISVSAIVGASGKAGAYNRVTTSYYNITGHTPINCGAKNQRACKVWERVPSCNKGMYEQIPQGICRAKSALRCGGKNQRACKVWERVPSCNKGLYEKFPTGMCRAKAKPKKLNCGAKNQRPCKLWERVPSCNRGLKEYIFEGRCR